jgi:hypothetical protein
LERFPHTDGVEDPRLVRGHVDAGSRTWYVVFRAAYMVVRRTAPLVRMLVALGMPFIGRRIVELALVGRRSGRPRPVLLTLLRVDGRWYVGHPNGPRAWLANLAAMDSLLVTLPERASVRVRPVILPPGAERDAVILATGEQQPIPARYLYRAARRHIFRAGIYVRLEPVS